MIEIDLETGDTEIDVGDMHQAYRADSRFAVHHGRVLQWYLERSQGSLEVPDLDNVRQMRDEIAPLVPIVLAGADICWDGSNHVGRLTTEARDACETITGIVESYEQTWTTEGGAWRIADWLGNSDLEEMEAEGAQSIYDAAAGDGIRLDGGVEEIAEYLADRRREADEEAAYDAAY